MAFNYTNSNTRVTQSGTDTDLSSLIALATPVASAPADTTNLVLYELVNGYETFTFGEDLHFIINGTMTINPNNTRLRFLRMKPENQLSTVLINTTGSWISISDENPTGLIPGVSTEDNALLRANYQNLFIEFPNQTNSIANTPTGNNTDLIGRNTEGDIGIINNVQWEGFNIIMRGSIQTITGCDGFIRNVSQFIPSQANGISQRGTIQQFYHNTDLEVSNFSSNIGEFLVGRAAQLNGLIRGGGLAALTLNGKAQASITRDANNTGTAFDFNGYVFFTGTGSSVPNLTQLNWRHAERLPRTITNNIGGNNSTERYYYSLQQELYINATDLSGNAVSGARYFIRDTDNSLRQNRLGFDDRNDRVYHMVTGTTTGSLATTQINDADVTPNYIDTNFNDRIEVTTAITNVDGSTTTVAQGQNASLSNADTPNNTIDIRTKVANPVTGGWTMDVPAWSYAHNPIANADIELSGVGGTTINNVFLPDANVTATETAAAALISRISAGAIDTGNNTRNIQITQDITLDDLYDILKYLKVNEATWREFPTAATGAFTGTTGSTLSLSNVTLQLTGDAMLTAGTKFTTLRMNNTARFAFDANRRSINFGLDNLILINARTFPTAQSADVDTGRATNFSVSGDILNVNVRVERPTTGTSFAYFIGGVMNTSFAGTGTGGMVQIGGLVEGSIQVGVNGVTDVINTGIIFEPVPAFNQTIIPVNLPDDIRIQIYSTADSMTPIYNDVGNSSILIESTTDNPLVQGQQILVVFGGPGIPVSYTRITLGAIADTREFTFVRDERQALSDAAAAVTAQTGFTATYLGDITASDVGANLVDTEGNNGVLPTIRTDGFDLQAFSNEADSIVAFDTIRNSTTYLTFLRGRISGTATARVIDLIQARSEILMLISPEMRVVHVITNSDGRQDLFGIRRAGSTGADGILAVDPNDNNGRLIRTLENSAGFRLAVGGPLRNVVVSTGGAFTDADRTTLESIPPNTNLIPGVPGL